MAQQKPTAANLRHARCLFHPLREAAALCPHCGGTYCRECVTDEDGKLACPPCLRKLARPPAPKLSPMNRLWQILMGLAALASLTVLVFILLRWRTDRPEQHVSFDNVGATQAPEQSDE
jgi:hypothetical protein